MRVVHVAPTPFGEQGIFGGGERYAAELADELAREVRCELVTFGPRTGTWTAPSGLRVHTLRSLRHIGGHPAHPLSVALPGAVWRADVVHAHHMRSAPSRIAAVTGKVGRRRVVVTDHGLGGGDWAGVLPRLFDRFLTVSAYSAEELGAPPTRTTVIYGGADPVRHHPDPDIVRRGVLFVGRITPHKGLDRLIRAVPPEVPLTVAGSAGHDPRPPERGYPELLRRLSADRDVRFVGPVSDGELPLLYRSAAVLALPSVHRTCYGREVAVSELLSLVALEAMASGTPVVASRVGGLPEIVRDGETGFLVEPGDVHGLRDRLSTVLGDRSIAERLGASGREWVMDRFTWRRCAERCLAAYEELVGRG